ncbi:unnamed protein product [Dibothriocephalus latus]|uniref:Uncharacterized protein n=1 Tax=Dibothriocephalus latus TaxID=60516 RepID=A0A3P6UU45_DIBLA|nr:unnamed protein product [Dibothriocephalus latus]
MNERMTELQAGLRNTLTEYKSLQQNVSFVLTQKDTVLAEAKLTNISLQHKPELGRSELANLQASFDELDRAGHSMGMCWPRKVFSPQHTMTELQASIEAYRRVAADRKTTILNEVSDSNEGQPGVKAESDETLPWNPCCVSAVSFIAALARAEPMQFSLIRDLSRLRSLSRELKALLESLQMEVEFKHAEIADKSRQLILLEADTADFLRGLVVTLLVAASALGNPPGGPPTGWRCLYASDVSGCADVTGTGVGNLLFK